MVGDPLFFWKHPKISWAEIGNFCIICRCPPLSHQRPLIMKFLKN